MTSYRSEQCLDAGHEALPVLGGVPQQSGDSDSAYALLARIGLVDTSAAGTPLPDRMAPFLALVEALPAALTERLLTELLPRLVEPG